ncbi:MAG: hypothetical protein KC456_13050 [Flavobacteriales bacterium]|nr:hypothetical protein [Flavobacteriales bacterium]
MQLQSTIGYLFFIGITLTACSTKDCEPSVNQVLENGTCVCRDGFSGKHCTLDDICLVDGIDPCEHGTCENNACTCKNLWVGDNCEIPLLAEYEGVYSISVTGDGQNRFHMGDVTLTLFPGNENMDAPFNRLMGEPYGSNTKLTSSQLEIYPGHLNLLFNHSTEPSSLNLGYWTSTHDKHRFTSVSMVHFDDNTIAFEGRMSITEYGQGGGTWVTWADPLTITLKRVHAER